MDFFDGFKALLIHKGNGSADYFLNAYEVFQDFLVLYYKSIETYFQLTGFKNIESLPMFLEKNMLVYSSWLIHGLLYYSAGGSEKSYSEATQFFSNNVIPIKYLRNPSNSYQSLHSENTKVDSDSFLIEKIKAMGKDFKSKVTKRFINILNDKISDAFLVNED